MGRIITGRRGGGSRHDKHRVDNRFPMEEFRVGNSKLISWRASLGLTVETVRGMGEEGCLLSEPKNRYDIVSNDIGFATSTK